MSFDCTCTFKYNIPNIYIKHGDKLEWQSLEARREQSF